MIASPLCGLCRWTNTAGLCKCEAKCIALTSALTAHKSAWNSTFLTYDTLFVPDQRVHICVDARGWITSQYEPHTAAKYSPDGFTALLSAHTATPCAAPSLAKMDVSASQSTSHPFTHGQVNVLPSDIGIQTSCAANMLHTMSLDAMLTPFHGPAGESRVC